MIMGILSIVPEADYQSSMLDTFNTKSTLVDLVPRYYDAEEGQILIDGVDVRELRTHDIRTLLGNVNQEAILFNDTFYITRSSQ